MKQIALILALYLLGLSAFPCVDVSHDCTDGHEEKTEIVNVSHSTEHPDTSEDCPPFCYCSCCGSLIIIDKKPLTPERTQWLLKDQPRYACLLIDQSFPESIFPPPKALFA